MIRRTIDALRAGLDRDDDARALLRRIEASLPELRESYRREPAEFTQSDIAFLQRLTPIRDALQVWLETNDRLGAVASVDALESAIARLAQLKDTLAAYPAGAALRKSTHGWRERLAAVRSEDEGRRAKIGPRIAELEQHPRRCRRNHRMAIREGPRGFFWGCKSYPFCHHVALLTKEEWDYLNARDGSPPAGLANARQLTLV